MHRLDYPLNEHSLVFDVGGYKGQWADKIFTRYGCTVYVFEPVAEFAKGIRRRFAGNGKVVVYEFGLSRDNQALEISICRDISSFHRGVRGPRKARLVRAADFISERNIESIDLMKVNIEGGEYDLLEHLINVGLVKRIRNIQVQFHSFMPNAEERMASIHSELRRTHRLTYQYLFVWENWQLCA